MMQTIVDRWKEEGINIGFKQGRAEGRQEKQREMIGLVLNHRFRLSEQEKEQLTKRLLPVQSEEMLDQLVNLALTTTILDFVSFMEHLGRLEKQPVRNSQS